MHKRFLLACLLAKNSFGAKTLFLQAPNFVFATGACTNFVQARTLFRCKQTNSVCEQFGANRRLCFLHKLRLCRGRKQSLCKQTKFLQASTVCTQFVHSLVRIEDCAKTKFLQSSTVCARTLFVQTNVTCESSILCLHLNRVCANKTKFGACKNKVFAPNEIFASKQAIKQACKQAQNSTSSNPCSDKSKSIT